MHAELHEALLENVRALTPKTGVNETAVPNFFAVRREATGEKPSFLDVYAALVLQGAKRSAVEGRTLRYRTGDVVVNSLERPTLTVIEEASPEAPFFSFFIKLDRKALLDLATNLQDDLRLTPEESTRYARLPMLAAPADDALADCYRRLSEAALNPDSARLLGPILQQEICARLLLGPLGLWIRSLCTYGTHARQIADAVERIRRLYAEPLRVEDLANTVGMSTATFHRHFKTLTGVSPLQYQKMTRLYEAQRLIRTRSTNVSQAAVRVGYASASQFASDYRTLFGRTPLQDRRLCEAETAGTGANTA